MQPGLKQDFVNIGRGFLMGGADIIPGVSGGTVALILGIYERLVTAISHCDLQLLRLLAGRDWKAALIHLDLRFLISLGIGIGAGIISLAGLMHYLLLEQHDQTMASFFGLIAASSWLVARMVQRWRPLQIFSVVAGACFAFWLVGLPVFQQPPTGLWYVFLCGVIAICAMILPGISGAFILLLLGKYAEVTGLIKGLVHGEISLQILSTIAVFCLGCAVGLIGFSKFLKLLLKNYTNTTMAVLAGFMVGSLRKLWPLQRDLTPEQTELKYKVYENLPLTEMTAGDALQAAGIVLVAGAAVLVLDYCSGWKSRSAEEQS